MKRFDVAMLVCWVGALAGEGARANGVDNAASFSAAQVRHQSQNAAVGTLDAVIYDPAGVTAFAEGFYVGLNNQTLLTRFSHSYQGFEYQAETPVPVLPAAELLYRVQDLGVFVGFTIPSGGGGLQFKNGTATTAAVAEQASAQRQDGRLSADVQSITFGVTLGAAYRVHERISLSLAVRPLYAARMANLQARPGALAQTAGTEHLLDQLETSQGIGAILGAHFQIGEKLRLGLRYETVTRLRFLVERSDLPAPLLALLSEETLVSLRKVFRPQGSRYDRDLPAVGALGLACQPTPRWSVSSSYTRYFQRSADWDGLEDDHRDGWELSAGTELALTPSLLLSLGGGYHDIGRKARAYLPEVPGQSGWTIGMGGRYALTPTMLLDLGVSLGLGESADRPDGVHFSGYRIYTLALGLDFKVF